MICAEHWTYRDGRVAHSYQTTHDLLQTNREADKWTMTVVSYGTAR